MRCRTCYECSDNDGRAVTLCPLHAQAEAMREFIEDHMTSISPLGEKHFVGCERVYCSLSCKSARALLRASEGK